MEDKQQLAEFLRADYAAQTIHKGQLAVLKNLPGAEKIQHIMEQEEVHIETPDSLLN